MGKVFGRLTVVERRQSNNHGRAMWRCVCVCGKEKITRTSLLTTGGTRSCGCLALERRGSQKPQQAPKRQEVIRPDHVRAAQAARARRRRAEDPKWRMDADFRRRVYGALRRPGIWPDAPLFQILGYSRSDLVAHLLITIPAGFNWLDYLGGRLELDHIFPLSSFDYASERDLGFRAAWSLGNLRLIPAGQNRAKGASAPHLSKPATPVATGPLVVTVECQETPILSADPEDPEMTPETSTGDAR